MGKMGRGLAIGEGKGRSIGRELGMGGYDPPGVIGETDIDGFAA
jgi:hypothetical protein